MVVVPQKHESIALLDAALQYNLAHLLANEPWAISAPAPIPKDIIECNQDLPVSFLFESYIYDCRSWIDATCGTSIPAWMSLTPAAPESFIAKANSCLRCSKPQCDGDYDCSLELQVDDVSLCKLVDSMFSIGTTDP